MTNGSLMKVKSIAECSPWSILQYLPALSKISLEKQFLVFLRVAVLHRFNCSFLMTQYTCLSQSKFGKLTIFICSLISLFISLCDISAFFDIMFVFQCSFKQPQGKVTLSDGSCTSLREKRRSILFAFQINHLS